MIGPFQEKQVKLKGFARGVPMSYKEYLTRIAEAHMALKEKVSNISVEQDKRFRREITNKIPFKDNKTYALEFEIKLFLASKHYGKLFKAELMGLQAPPLPPAMLIPVPFTKKNKAPKVIIKQLSDIGAEFEKKFPGGIEHMKRLRDADEEEHEAKAEYANGVLLHMSLYGITPF